MTCGGDDIFSFFFSSFTGALEMLSMEMKAAGMYVSRGLSYQDAEVRLWMNFTPVALLIVNIF